MSDPLFKNLQENRFYFCHSYCYKDLSQSFVTSSCFHGERFVSSVRKGRVWATQFHPEKSHKYGIQLYKTSLKLREMHNYRVIPCLLLTELGLVKTVAFKNGRYIGDPINAVRIFNERG